MNVDFLGRVRKIALADRHGFQPVFEALVNSVDAIEEAGKARGHISVELFRDVGALSPEAHGNTIAPLVSVRVVDDGVGFTTPNFQAFETVDSTRKLPRGGKGVGRLLWLAAFERAEIDSTYFEDGKWWRRRFEFRPTPSGVESATLEQLSGSATRRTEVALLGFHERFQAATSKSAEAIGRRIVEHCLAYFLLGRMPRLELLDPTEAARIDLNELFERQFQPQAGSRQFQVQGRSFTLKDVLLRKEGDLTHQLHFCAHDRVVRSLPLAGRVAHMPHTIARDGEAFVYHGYVSSAVLDEKVDPDRTRFLLDQKGELGLEGGANWEDIVEGAVGMSAQTLGPVTEATKERAVERIRSFVAEKAPKYRPLLRHRRAGIERIPADLSDDKLDLELHRLHSEWRGDLRHRTQEQLDRAEGDDLQDLGFRERMSALLGEIEEASKSELAEYVVQRRAVLDLFQRLLGLQESGRFAKEDSLHDLMFPRRRTSDDVDYDSHNLWLLDERLAYHIHLSSDKPLANHGGPITSPSDRRPDLLIYNRAMAFADSGSAISSVVIVEFKRPERDDYTDAENPVRQVIDYITDLRGGRAKRPDGASVELPSSVPFYCYIVATGTPRLKREAEAADYKKTPDGLGYFTFHTNLNAYIEILSYRKVLEDAKKRNRAFFERLDMPIF